MKKSILTRTLFVAMATLFLQLSLPSLGQLSILSQSERREVSLLRQLIREQRVVLQNALLAVDQTTDPLILAIADEEAEEAEANLAQLQAFLDEWYSNSASSQSSSRFGRTRGSSLRVRTEDSFDETLLKSLVQSNRRIFAITRSASSRTVHDELLDFIELLRQEAQLENEEFNILLEEGTFIDEDTSTPDTGSDSAGDGSTSTGAGFRRNETGVPGDFRDGSDPSQNQTGVPGDIRE